MAAILISLVFILLILGITQLISYILYEDKECPYCGTPLDNAGNSRYCRKCRKLFDMNIFGKLKERL